MRVHDVKEVGEGNFSSFVLQVRLELGDGGARAQGPHDDSQLVHGLDLTRPGVEVETFPELVNILLLEMSGLEDRVLKRVPRVVLCWTCHVGRK